MQILKKYKTTLLIVVFLTALFFASRLYNIMSLPIFTDEAIYVRWSQIAGLDANWRFISLTDGKQPSFVWLTMIIMRFVEDPLLSGRLVSVGAGFISMVGMFFLGRELFRNKEIGILSSILYLVFPMAVVYDRMALYDSLVGTFAVWSLYLAVLLVRRLRLDAALILGMVLGGGVLTKSSGFISIYLLPFTLLLFNWGKRDRTKRFIKWGGLVLLSAVLAYMYYSVLRLSPFFRIINEKNALFVYPLSEWLKHTFRFIHGNIIGLSDWFIAYTGWTVLILIILSFFLSRSYFREKIFLLFCFLTPFFALALFGKTLYPRFIFFMSLSLLPLAAYSLFMLFKKISNKTVFALLAVVLFFSSLRFDYYIITDFAKAPTPRIDRSQYINGWPAGGGIKEAVEFFGNEAKNKKIYVATQGTFGLLPYALEIYLGQNPNITIAGFWPLDEAIPKEVKKASEKMPTYMVFYQPCNTCPKIGEAPSTFSLIKIAQYRKGTSQREFLTIYSVY